MTITAPPTEITEAPVRGRYEDAMDAMDHAPKQDRARRNVAAMLAAAERFIEAGEIDRFTSADIVREAGVSIGLFYRYFPDRVAILDAVRPDRHLAAEQLEHTLRLLADARQTLRIYAHRIDPFVYDEFAGALADAPTDHEGRDMIAAVDLTTGAAS